MAEPISTMQIMGWLGTFLGTGFASIMVYRKLPFSRKNGGVNGGSTANRPISVEALSKFNELEDKKLDTETHKLMCENHNLRAQIETDDRIEKAIQASIDKADEKRAEFKDEILDAIEGLKVMKI